jgi:Transglycosylase SLT domain
MRAILTLAFLIVSLKGAVPEVKYQDQLGAAADRPTTSDVTINTQAEPGPTYQWALALLPTSADAPHHQGEDQTSLPQSSALATSDVRTDQLPPDSIETLCTALLASAQRNDLPVTFFANLIWQESGFQRDAVSSAGALGIAQFMPEVAREVGLGNPLDPHEALPASAKLLRTLRDQFGNLGFAAAAYNAGPHRVSDWLEHGRTLPLETQNYVTRVTGRSIETWRKSPLDDSQVTFVRPLPCRTLPAFAELEQAQDAERDLQPHQDQAAAAEMKAANTPAAHHPAQMFRPVLVARRVSVERHLAVTNRPAGAEHVVRNFRVERLEAVHRPHPVREKRRVV